MKVRLLNLNSERKGIMVFEDVLKISATILTSLGGAGVVILGLSNWLGKVWAFRIQESDRNKYLQELETLKASYTKELEEKRAVLENRNALLNRYSEHQFILYTELYKSLYDLKIAADDLWEKGEFKTLKNFSKQLNETIHSVEKSVLLIEDKHYEQLSKLLDTFANYKIGKTELIKMRNKNEHNSSVYSEDIFLVINNNSIRKDEYTEIINEIGNLFKSQIKLGG